MAGEAKTNAFMLGTATVMIGPVADVFSLTEADHSIGLVKNFQITAEPTYTELMQGVKGNIVYSVMTGNPVKATMEAYEFTAKNLAYGLGLDGSALTSITTNHVLKTQIVGGVSATSVVVSSETDISGSYPVGTYMYLQDGTSDRIHLAMVSSVAYVAMDEELTITMNAAVPTGLTFPVGTKVSKAHRSNVGDKSDQPYFGAKIVGILPEGNQPLIIIMPKIRVTRGFTLAFQTENFGNLPFEMTPYELVSTDPLYAQFQDKGPAAVFGRL